MVLYMGFLTWFLPISMGLAYNREKINHAVFNVLDGLLLLDLYLHAHTGVTVGGVLHLDREVIWHTTCTLSFLLLHTPYDLLAYVFPESAMWRANFQIPRLILANSLTRRAIAVWDWRSEMYSRPIHRIMEISIYQLWGLHCGACL